MSDPKRDAQQELSDSITGVNRLVSFFSAGWVRDLIRRMDTILAQAVPAAWNGKEFVQSRDENGDPIPSALVLHQRQMERVIELEEAQLGVLRKIADKTSAKAGAGETMSKSKKSKSKKGKSKIEFDISDVVVGNDTVAVRRDDLLESLGVKRGKDVRKAKIGDIVEMNSKLAKNAKRGKYLIPAVAIAGVAGVAAGVGGTLLVQRLLADDTLATEGDNVIDMAAGAGL